MSEPAFPFAFDTKDFDGADIKYIEYGMTLRDYFATHAPQPEEYWKQKYARERGYKSEMIMIATWNYEYADAMLEARKQ